MHYPWHCFLLFMFIECCNRLSGFIFALPLLSLSFSHSLCVCVSLGLFVSVFLIFLRVFIPVLSGAVLRYCFLGFISFFASCSLLASGAAFAFVLFHIPAFCVFAFAFRNQNADVTSGSFLFFYPLHISLFFASSSSSFQYLFLLILLCSSFFHFISPGFSSRALFFLRVSLLSFLFYFHPIAVFRWERKLERYPGAASYLWDFEFALGFA